MEVRLLFLLFTPFGLFAASATASDLTKIERSIAKEPAYASRAPTYCLLVIGPEAKTRIWLVLDGDALFVDRNQNGNLTDEGERVQVKRKRGEPAVFDVGEILDSDGKTVHKDLHVIQAAGLERTATFVVGKIAGMHVQAAGAAENETLRFANRASDAPIIHFGGPLRMGLSTKFSKRKILERNGEIAAHIGTPGLGEGTFAVVMHDNIPASAHPVAEVEFASTDMGARPVKITRTLKERC